MIQLSVIAGLATLGALSFFFIKLIIDLEEKSENNDKSNGENGKDLKKGLGSSGLYLFLKLLGILVFLFYMLTISTYMFSNQEMCEIVVANSTINGLNTTYNHSYECFPEESSMFTNNMKFSVLFYRIIVFAYVIFFMFIAIKKLIIENEKLRSNFKQK